MTIFFMVLGVVILICALLFLWRSIRITQVVDTTRQALRVPRGTITYADLVEPAQPFFSHRLMLAGKPDFIVKKNKRYIPVEVKSGDHETPQRNHLFQLAAYCYLLEETYNTFVPYGVLIYKNADFKIPFDPRLRFELESVVQRMQGSLRNDTGVVNHQDPRRCRMCSLRECCSKKPV